MNVEPGIYLHFKGNRYLIHGTAVHSETGESLVIYEPLYLSSSEPQLWVRPATMFAEQVNVDGALVPRFERVGP
jgi:hypothetical protein